MKKKLETQHSAGKKQASPETFRVNDPAVQKLLEEAKAEGNASAVINEALRLHGGQAVINVLKDEIALTERKLARVMEAQAKLGRKSA